MDLGAQPLATGPVTTVALAGDQGDGSEVDEGAREGFLWLGKVWHDGHTPVPAGAAKRKNEVDGPAESSGPRCVGRVRLPVILVSLAEAGCNILVRGLVVVKGATLLPCHTASTRTYTRTGRFRPLSLPLLDPLGLKLRPHPDQQGGGPHDAPRLHQADGIADGKIGARRGKRLMEVEDENKGHQGPARGVQPWAVDVGGGKVEDGEKKRAEHGVGQYQWFDAARGDLVRKVKAVTVTDVGAKVGRSHDRS